MLPYEMQHFMPGFAESNPSTFHADTIHHVEFDYYGQRVATVSSDKTVCIWDRDKQGNWWKNASWKKHGGAVWKARFAHPEYGQVLATCSFDNTIQIFDKDAIDSVDSRSMGTGGPDSSNGWVCRAMLRQSTSSITDIQFAPHYLGLQLAACTSSGRIIIYEAEDMMALDIWNVLFDGEVCSHRLASISWSTNRFDPPYLAVSSDDMDALPSEKLFIFRVNANNGLILTKPQTKERDGAFDSEDQITVISFGPSCGLSVHNLAVAAGAKIRVYTMTTGGGGNNTNSNGSSSSMTTANENGAGDFMVKGTEVLEEGSSQVVRLSWNVLGDALYAVHADGLVRVWIYTFANRWTQLSTITPPVDQERTDNDNVYY